MAARPGHWTVRIEMEDDEGLTTTVHIEVGPGGGAGLLFWDNDTLMKAAEYETPSEAIVAAFTDLSDVAIQVTPDPESDSS